MHILLTSVISVDLPDRVIDRATEAAERERARALWHEMGEILFRPR